MNTENLQVLSYDDNWRSLWDDFVRSHPDSCYSHLIAWSRVVSSALGHKPCSLLAIEGQQIKGILPAFLAKHWLFGKFLVSAPAANTGGILAVDEYVESLLVQAVKYLAARLNVRYTELRQENHQLPELQADSSYVTTLIPLDPDPQVVRQRVSYKIRRDLNRAARDGLLIDRGHEFLEDFYRVYKTRMHQLGSPAFGRSFFIAVCEQFGKNADVVVVRRQGRTVAANIAIHHRDRIYNLFAGAEESAMKSGAISLFCWDQIRRGCLSGMRFYDLGRSTARSSTHHYKSFWHGKDIPLHYSYIPHRCAVIPDKHPDNPHYRLAKNTWKKLPAFITDCLGPKIVKYLL